MKKTAIAVCIFLILFCLLLIREARADAFVSVGAPLVQGKYAEGGALTMGERLGGKYDLKLTLISTQHSAGRGDLASNGVASIQRIVAWNRLELGLGLAHWTHTSAIIGCETGYNLSAAYRMSSHVAVRWDHWSNAGTCQPNTGQDALGIEYRF